MSSCLYCFWWEIYCLIFIALYIFFLYCYYLIVLLFYLYSCVHSSVLCLLFFTDYQQFDYKELDAVSSCFLCLDSLSFWIFGFILFINFIKVIFIIFINSGSISAHICLNLFFLSYPIFRDSNDSINRLLNLSLSTLVPCSLSLSLLLLFSLCTLFEIGPIAMSNSINLFFCNV